jgi:Protein of unknown function (DUF2490)
MGGFRRWWLAITLLLVFTYSPANAQTFQFLPETDVYLKLSSNIRFTFQAKDTRENGGPNQFEVGPTIDFYVKPLVKLKRFTVFQLDDSKSRVLVLSAGYRYLPSGGSPADNRVVLQATSSYPLKYGVSVADRNRGELNFQSGDFYWRYRNRLTVERTFGIRSYHPTPYASVEVYYDSKYDKWSSTVLYVGCSFPIRKHAEIEPYYDHQNNTGKSPNQQINAFGLILDLYH